MPRYTGLTTGKKRSTINKHKAKKATGRPMKQSTIRRLKAEKGAAVKQVYSIVNKVTGSIGGNGSGGPIYGELAQSPMDRVIDRLIKDTGFGAESRMVDVGCGRGKPSLHAAQYPRIEFSFGIEVEELRTNLGLINLHQVLQAAKSDHRIGHSCLLQHGDITEANCFDPFTHVYQFDVGFEPELMITLADMFNRSSVAQYLISYKPPKRIIEEFMFDVELIGKMNTSMHASGEGHTCYFFRRVGGPGPGSIDKCFDVPCDPLFKQAWTTCKGGLESVDNYVAGKVDEFYREKPTRARKKPVRLSP